MGMGNKEKRRLGRITVNGGVILKRYFEQ